jgi:microcystin-dependent protein
MAAENFYTSSNVSTEGTEIDLSAAFLAGDQYLSGGVVYSSSSGKFVSTTDNIPVGIVRMWAKGSANATPPDDYLVCDGGSISVATYPKLHSVIGYRFGGSSGSFNLPRLNVTSGTTYRVPSGVDTGLTESDELNNVSSISIGSNDSLSHTHQISTFTFNSTTGNSANLGHSHANSNSATGAHQHTFANTAITTNASHSHNWGNANANHTHSYADTGGENAVTGNPLQNHAHNTGNTIGNHVHNSSSSTHQHVFGNTSFNSNSTHTHELSILLSSESTSHSHSLDSVGTYFIIKYR